MSSIKKVFSLRPRARIVRTFGEELISNNSVAIIELVKNSYDADAQNVEIEFVGPLKEGEGSIIITDNGTGMSPGDVETYWMEPASVSKYSKRRSKSGRAYLGQKGIGRFSTAKLADKLTLITHKKGFEEVEAEFNWENYYAPDKYLDEIQGEWSIGPPVTILNTGTVLRMQGLRSSWTEDDVRELMIQLQRLVSPVAPQRNFSIEMKFPKGYEEFSGQVTPSQMLKDPDYTISGQLDTKGDLSLTYSSKGSDGIEEINKSKIKMSDGNEPVCGPVEFEFRVWDRDKLDDIASELRRSINSIRADLNAVSGVSIYRDDFRVSPYGNYRNDWLRLDLRRVQSPTMRISNNQVVGRMSISGDSNPDLKDQTNREGIVESRALDDLRDIAKIALTELEKRRYRERRPEGGEAATKGIALLQQKIDLDSVRAVVEKNVPDDKEIGEALDKKETEINEQIDELREVITTYRRLSTMGQLMDVVLHEVGNYIARIRNGVNIIDKEVVEPNDKVKKNVVNVKEGARLLTDTFKRLEPFGGRKRERAKDVILEDSIESVFGLFENELEEKKVHVSLPKTKTTVKLSDPEFKQVFINLLTNSLYWLGQTPSKDKHHTIDVELNADEEMITIIFSDNGPGIDPRDAPHIFEPYFTSRPDGVGLGLTIVGEIVTQYGGDLSLVSSNDGGASFKIQLPRSR